MRPVQPLRRAFDWRPRSKQEEMAAAEGAAVGQNQPEQRFFPGVADADASEIHRFAMRTVWEDHGLSSSPLRLLTPPCGADVLTHGPVRWFSFPGSRAFPSRGPLSRAGAHLFLGEGYRLKFAALFRLVQKTAAQEWQFLYLDAIPSYQRQIGPDRAFRAYPVLSRAFKCEDAKSHILGESDQSELHL
jgi:hypothetical protein